MTADRSEAQTENATEPNLRWAVAQLEQALRGLQYGEVTIVVQDGVVVQLERTERKRPPRRASGS
jgi:hypothetical protein